MYVIKILDEDPLIPLEIDEDWKRVMENMEKVHLIKDAAFNKDLEYLYDDSNKYKIFPDWSFINMFGHKRYILTTQSSIRKFKRLKLHAEHLLTWNKRKAKWILRYI